jgi:hypothetical protein
MTFRLYRRAWCVQKQTAEGTPRIYSVAARRIAYAYVDTMDARHGALSDLPPSPTVGPGSLAGAVQLRAVRSILRFDRYRHRHSSHDDDRALAFPRAICGSAALMRTTAEGGDDGRGRDTPDDREVWPYDNPRRRREQTTDADDDDRQTRSMRRLTRRVRD